MIKISDPISSSTISGTAFFIEMKNFEPSSEPELLVPAETSLYQSCHASLGFSLLELSKTSTPIKAPQTPPRKVSELDEDDYCI